MEPSLCVWHIIIVVINSFYLMYVFEFPAQINKVTVREYSRNDTHYGFELERKDDGSSSSSKQSSSSNNRNSFKENSDSNNSSSNNNAKDDSVIVVICDSEAQRDEALKLINGQILELKDIAKRMVNPFL